MCVQNPLVNIDLALNVMPNLGQNLLPEFNWRNKNCKKMDISPIDIFDLTPLMIM